MLRIGVLVSGGGTNLQAIIDSIVSGYLEGAEISLVLSNKENAYALERAAKANIKTCVVKKKDFIDQKQFDLALVQKLKENNVDIVLLAGFMSILGSDFISAYKNKILNIHPSLLPAFGGKGYFGLKVHEKVLAAGEKVTGATVHYVTDEVDAGPIVLQKQVEVKAEDTPETLQKRVMEECEWKIYPEAVKKEFL